MSEVTSHQLKYERRSLSVRELLAREQILKEAIYVYSFFGSVIALCALVVIAHFLL